MPNNIVSHTVLAKIILFLLCIACIACSKDDSEQSMLEQEEKLVLEAGARTVFTYFSDSVSLLELDVYTPDNWHKQAHLPCVIYFHGGVANSLQYQLQCEHFAQRGIVAISVNHRYKNLTFYSKKRLIDGYIALEWIQNHADCLGINVHKIALGGSSAGASVVLFTYQVLQHLQPEHVIMPDAFVLANPYITDAIQIPEYASCFPQTIIFQGDNDDLTALEDVQVYCDNASSAGADSIHIIVYPGRNHGFFNYEISPDDFYHTLYTADSFLVRRAYIPEFFCQD